MNLVPTVIEKSQFGERAYDIYSKLLEERIIFLGAPINDLVANSVIAQLLFLAQKDSAKEIKLYINSPGGSVSSGLAIYDTMQYIKCPVSTICIGIAASMSAILLAAGAEGQAEDIRISAEHILKAREQLNQILAKHTQQPIKKIAHDTDRDYYMNPTEAKNYGIIDKIIGNNK